MVMRLLVIFAALCLSGAVALATQAQWRWALMIGVPATVALLLGLFHRIAIVAARQARRDRQAGIAPVHMHWVGD